MASACLAMVKFALMCQSLLPRCHLSRSDVAVLTPYSALDPQGKKVTLIHLDPTGASGLALAAGGGHLGLVHAFLQKVSSPVLHAPPNFPNVPSIHSDMCR